MHIPVENNLSCTKDCDKPCKKKEVKVIYCETKHDATHLMGTFMDKSHYDVLIDEDTDVYAPSIDGTMSEENIVLKFRKNVFTKEEQEMAYQGLREAATITQNRGLASGPREESLGARHWVTDEQFELLVYLMISDVCLIMLEALIKDPPD